MISDNHVEARIRSLLGQGEMDSRLVEALPALIAGQRRARRNRRLLMVAILPVAVLGLAGFGLALQDDTPTAVVADGPTSVASAGPGTELTVVSREFPELDLKVTLTASSSAPVLQRVEERLGRVAEISGPQGRPPVPDECYPDRAFYVDAESGQEAIQFVGEGPVSEDPQDRFVTLTYPEGTTATSVPFGKIIDRPGTSPIAVLAVRVHDVSAASVTTQLATGESSQGPVVSGWSILAIQLDDQTSIANWYVGSVQVLAADGKEVFTESLPHNSEVGDYC